MGEMPTNEEGTQTFAVESHRFEIDADADLLTQVIEVARKIVTLDRSHKLGARVRAVIVETERPI